MIYQYVIVEETKMENVVSKEMIISDILSMDLRVVPILLNAGMHCVGCPSAQGESLEQACIVHGIDVDALVEEINKFMAENPKKED